ncbi:adenylate/guanylate cyclase domain-containing protein [Solimonas terrae]|uniref:AAA family ATPase n=1 Tax=Solimonas terrae TaxID=1396819 RepID=A0A6M2BUN4_9GAMM|nr:adenylate/guanylate cyclase domain-containing protein [Solimonas terrae]NGY06094.1 AAA family ATPase [Solimonas terrae]
MKACASCQAENPENARFCNQCGASLAASPGPAPAAGYTPRHLRDGALRAAGAIAGERKRVTVLFADIKGSTRLAEQAGAELWHEVLDRFFGFLTQAVHRYDGTVNQYTGDGIMALFGAPVALEDHALRAAHAALDMQQAVRRYADELRLAHGLNLSMRIGLNSGEVVVGRIGDDLRSDYTAQGPTVNLAARLEHLCEPGRVYVSRATALQLEGYCRLRPLGAAQLAGHDEPQEVFELEDAGVRHERLQRSLARSGSPFLGRAPELAQLQRALDDARGGQGRVLAVIGSAGLGKSRLCHEFVEGCARAGVAVHRCSGVPYARRVPLLPIRDLLRGRLGVPAAASDEQARQWIAGALTLQISDAAALLPHVFEFLGIAAHGGSGMVEAQGSAQEQMLDRLATFLCCGEQPRVLLIEDLHFLDPATEAFILRLARVAVRERCLLLLNYRPDYPVGALDPVIGDRLQLRPLAAADLEDLARTLLGADPSLAPIVATLVERAAGHPYFVEEAVLALAEGGWLSGSARAWRLARPIDEWPLPDSVQALLAARIDRLEDAMRALLQAAAVIGQRFDAALLSAVVGDDATRVDARLLGLANDGFVRSDDEGWVFAHPLLQEVAYRGQLESRRRGVHAELARLLEQRHGPIEPPREISTRIAHHWRGAGDAGRAGLWGLAAARWVSTRNFETATDQCRVAIADLDRAGGDDPALIRTGALARAMLLRLAQFTPIAADELERAYEEARRMVAADDVALRAELGVSYGNRLLHRGRVDEAARTHEQAIALAMAHGETSVINRFRVAFLISFNAAGRLRQVLELLDATGDDWRTRPVDKENYMSRAYYGLMLGWMGRLDEAYRHLQAAMQIAIAEQGAAMSWMYAALVDLALLSGDFPPALMAAERGMRCAAESGSPFLRAIAQRALGLALGLNDRRAEAIEVLREAQPMVGPNGLAHLYEANLLATLALIEQEAGREQEAERTVQAACVSARGSGSRVWEILAVLVWLRQPVRAARRGEAREAIARVDELMAFTGAEGFRPWLHLARAHWSEHQEEVEAFTALARQAFVTIGAPAYAGKLQAEAMLDAAG